MTIIRKWQANTWSHLHCWVRKQPTSGVLLYCCCASIHSGVRLNTIHLPCWGLGMRAAPRKGRHRPMFSFTVWPCPAPNCSPRTTTLSCSWGGSEVLFHPKLDSLQGYLQLSSGFWEWFASAVSRGSPQWQWGLPSEGTLPNPWKILHGKNRV